MKSKCNLRFRLQDVNYGVDDTAHLSNRQWLVFAGYQLPRARIPPQIRHHLILIDEVEAYAVLHHVRTRRSVLQLGEAVLHRLHGFEGHCVSQGLGTAPLLPGLMTCQEDR